MSSRLVPMLISLAHWSDVSNNGIVLPKEQLPVQSQQYKQLKRVWNVNNTDTKTDTVRMFLLLTFNIFHTFV